MSTPPQPDLGRDAQPDGSPSGSSRILRRPQGVRRFLTGDESTGTTRWVRFDWIILALVLLTEFLVFDQLAARQHTWVYPRWNDQIQYLTEAYTGYEYAREHGFVRGMWQALINPSAQGTLHDCLAIVVFSLVGPSRSAALSLNMLAFIAWQVALFAAVTQFSRGRFFAWMTIALTLAIRLPWSGAPGSAADFRLDWIAACGMGVALAASVATIGFRSLRASLFFGAIVAGVLMTRFLTGAYFATIFAAFAVWVLVSRDQRWLRARNLLLAAATAAAIAAPTFWINRSTIINYYVVGHFIGPESALRSPNMGVNRSVSWIWDQVSQNHLGPTFGWLALLVTTGLIGAWLSRVGTDHTWRPEATLARAGAVPAAAFLFGPALILTLHQQKSEVVLSIMLPGAILLVLCVWEILTQALSPRGSAVLAGVAVLFAGISFVRMAAKPAHTEEFARSARRVSTFADYIFAHARAAQLPHPRVAVDRVTDSLDAQVLRVICYERKKVWVPYIMTLPTGIAEEREEVLLERLAQSDFVFLTDQGGSTFWPYDRQMQRLQPALRAWCEAHFKLVERFELFGSEMSLYQRPEIP
jgi:hypothetical protein